MFVLLDLASLTAEVAELFTPQARQTQLDVAVDATPAPLRVRGDRGALVQALLNVSRTPTSTRPPVIACGRVAPPASRDG